MNLFQAISKNEGRAVAVVCEDGELTYSELLERTVRMGKVFSFLEVAQGDRIGLLLHDSPEFLSAFIAICSLGAIAVPINTALTAVEQRAILNDCSASLAVVESDLLHSLLTAASDSLHFPETLLSIDRTRPLQVRKFDSDFKVTKLVQNYPPTTLYDLSDTLSEADSLPEPDFDHKDTEPAFILYTSGSTGEPKGAVHRQSDIFVTNNTFCREVLDLQPNDRLFSSSRLPFAYGLGNSFSFPLMNGAISILCRAKPTPHLLSKVFRERRPTIFFGVPVVYNLLLEHHRVEPLDTSSLRLCVSAGEALPAQIGMDWQQAFGVSVLDGIGSTEMLHMFMSNHVGDVQYGTSGKLLAGYEAKLLDEKGQPVPPNTEGNLWVKGESAALGYWRRPVETSRTFVEGWVRTGDLYRCDSEGYWSHMGRSDDCFKSSGNWVSPVEVEGVLVRHPLVSQAAVVEDFDENGLSCATAFVVSQKSGSSAVLEVELNALVSESLPRFKRPQRYFFVEELPYTATGKVQRFKLRERLRQKSRVV